MRVTIDERRIIQLARQHLKPNVADWWIAREYGCEKRGIPSGLSYSALSKRLRVPVATLHDNMKHAERIMVEALKAEEKQFSGTLVFVRETAPDCVSYAITLAEGHDTRTVIDKTQRKAVEGR